MFDFLLIIIAACLIVLAVIVLGCTVMYLPSAVRTIVVRIRNSAAFLRKQGSVNRQPARAEARNNA